MIYGERFRVPIQFVQCGVICGDGVELMGLASATSIDSEVDAVVLYLPGQFDNAYQQRKNHLLALRATEAGFGCVMANSRGQDYYGYQRKYPDPANPSDYSWEQLGSTFERVRDAHYDLDAWLSFVTEVAPNARVILGGHSHGAIKIANYMALHEDAQRHARQVAGIVLLSPSDDIGSQRDTLGSRFDEAVDVARGYVESGNAETLMPEWAFSAPMSAGTYYEAFGPESPLKTFAFHAPEASPLPDAGWTQPTLVVFGSDDGATGPLSSDDAASIASRLLSSSQSCDTVVVPDTNHHYRDAESTVADAVVTWAIRVLREDRSVR